MVCGSKCNENSNRASEISLELYDAPNGDMLIYYTIINTYRQKDSQKTKCDI